MKKVSRNQREWISPILLFLTLILFGVNIFAQEKKITVLTEEWPPYNYTENKTLTGFSVEVVQHIIRELNANAVIEIYPSMRALHLLNNEKNKMFVSMFRTQDREEKYHWIGPLLDSSIYFYKKKGNPLQITTMEDAKRVNSIATRHAGLVFNVLKASGFTNLDSRAVSGEHIYRKLLLGKSDLGISDSSIGVKYILRKLNYPSDVLVQTKVKVVNATLYIAASKDIPVQEIARWQKSLNNMKASGAYERVFKKYND